jgi:hypothetical protein
MTPGQDIDVDTKTGTVKDAHKFDGHLPKPRSVKIVQISKNENKRYSVKSDHRRLVLKGIVSRDFRPLVFFMKRTYLVP